jgi:hypothetical protein
MKQAYQHLSKGNTYYDHVAEMVKKCVDVWNSTHNVKADINVIADIFKTIFKYHHWIKVDDIEPSIELGLMGEFGENKGLNTETIFNWFKGYSRSQKENEIKSHSAYQTKSTFISEEQRKEIRLSLIQTFLNFLEEYKKTKVYNSEMDHYIPVFWRWFKKLGISTITDDDEMRMLVNESERLSDLRSFLERKTTKRESTTVKKIFIETFIEVSGMDIDFETQLKTMSY